MNLSFFYELNRFVKRKEKQCFLVENTNFINLAEQYELKAIEKFTTSKILGYKTITPKEMSKITGNNFIKEVAIFENFKNKIEENQSLIVLDQVKDLGNIGTIIRTCYAFGFFNIIFLQEDSDIYHHKVFEASRGLIFKVKPMVMNKEQFFNKIKLENYFILGGHMYGTDINKHDIKKIQEKNIMIIFGNESFGISEDLKNIIEEYITIKTDFESLNVAVASGIILNAFKYKNI
jgi:TrmH family RNA methyltransferase